MSAIVTRKALHAHIEAAGHAIIGREDVGTTDVATA